MTRLVVIALIVSVPATVFGQSGQRPLLGLSRALNLLGQPAPRVQVEEDSSAAEAASAARRAGDLGPSSHWSRSASSFRVKPVEFVGKKDECFPGYPAGAAFVAADWIRGVGLPDNGQPNSNPADPRDNPAKKDKHYGLLLYKNGPTPDCSAAGARITNTPGTFVLNELGFDYPNGGHCGAGSPRFNAITPAGLVYFIGCAHGSKTAAPQEPLAWTRVRFNTDSVHPQLDTNPPFQFGVTPVARLVIVADEGTDLNAGVAGRIVVDNVVLNGGIETEP